MPTNNVKSNKAALIAILAVYFLQAGGNAINSALQTIAEAFPSASPTTIRMIAILPNISSMLLGLALGNRIGRRIRYKTTFLAGICMFIIGGTGPAFFHNGMEVILLFRFIFGLSVGCFSFCNAYILSTTEKAQQAKYIGFGAVASNIGAAILQMVSGTLADLQWDLVFYPYLIGVVSLVLVLFLFSEPDECAVSENADILSASPSQRIGSRTYIYFAIQFFLMITCVSVMTGMSSIISQRGLGGAKVVAVVLTVCQAGGIVIGAVLGVYVRVFKQFAMPAALFIQALGILLVFIGRDLAVIGIGSFTSGIGTILVGSLNATFAGQSTSREAIPRVTIILMITGQLATFLSNYFIAACDALVGTRFVLDVESAFCVSVFIYAIMITAVLVYNLKSKQPI